MKKTSPDGKQCPQTGHVLHSRRRCCAALGFREQLFCFLLQEDIKQSSSQLSVSVFITYSTIYISRIRPNNDKKSYFKDILGYFEFVIVHSGGYTNFASSETLYRSWCIYGRASVITVRKHNFVQCFWPHSFNSFRVIYDLQSFPMV